jgi:predicted TIM-barrel fold metal-dependent hydrolase
MELPGAYPNIANGPRAHANANAKSFVAAAAERMVWGSHWPRWARTPMPDNARLPHLMAEWVDDDRARGGFWSTTLPGSSDLSERICRMDPGRETF